MFPQKRLPTSGRALLAAVPTDWRDQADPARHRRRWPTGSLPSFIGMGATGEAAFGGIVIYPEDVYRHVVRPASRQLPKI